MKKLSFIANEKGTSFITASIGVLVLGLIVAVSTQLFATHTIQNKKDMESADENDQAQFRNRLRNIMRDPEKNRAYLQRISMIESLQRAAKIS